MAYKALYRSYRPGKFLEVVGQKPIIKTLQNAIKENKTSHAYVFSGSRGIGKTTIARIFAKAVNCEQPENGEPCNICKNCLAVINDSTTDIVELDAASNNGVDDMRDILEKVNFLPSALKKKVYIIDEAHMLTQSSFNALLKTLEEPPSYIVFIFATTEPNKLPATILSRCQRFNFKPLTQKEINDNLRKICEKENILITDEALNCISEAAEGGMRDALSILDQVSVYSNGEIQIEDVENVIGKVSVYKSIEILNALRNKDAGTALSLLNDLVDNGKEISRITSNFTQFCRDLLLYKTTEKKEFYKHIFEIREFQEIAEEITERELFYYIDIFVNIQNKIRFSNTPKIFLEIGIMKIVSNVATDLDFDERITKLENRQPSTNNYHPMYNMDNQQNIENRLMLLENKIKKLYAEIDKMNIPGLKETINSKFEILEDSASFVATLPKDLPYKIETLEQNVKELNDRLELYHNNAGINISTENSEKADDSNVKEEISKINDRISALESNTVTINNSDIEYNNAYEQRILNLEESNQTIISRLENVESKVDSNNSTNDINVLTEIEELKENFIVLLKKVQDLQNIVNNTNREEFAKRRNPFEQPKEENDDIIFADEIFDAPVEEYPVIDEANDIYTEIENIKKNVEEQIKSLNDKFENYVTITEFNEAKEEINNNIKDKEEITETIAELKEYVDNVKDYSFKLNIKVTAIEEEVEKLKQHQEATPVKVETTVEEKKEEPVKETVVEEKKEEPTSKEEQPIIVEEQEQEERTVESVYNVRIVERILHQARDPKCREEKVILLEKWEKLDANVGPMLANTAKLLSNSKLVANGFNELLIVYPNATLCNHMMEEKTHLQAKQILRIVFGKEYDFIALPENVWQYKRMEYRGQYSMGIRYPKLTPINDPGLKVIKTANATLGINKPQPLQQARNIFGDDLVDTEGEK